MTEGNLHHQHNDGSDIGKSEKSKLNTNDKTVPDKDESHEHHPLINTLSNKDWQSDKNGKNSPSNAEIHLPHTAITHSTVSERERRETLTHDLTDTTKTKRQRLEAAHQLAAARNNDIVSKDQNGKTLHLNISETNSGQTSRIVVSQVDGADTKGRPYLEGTLEHTDSTEKLETSADDSKDKNIAKPSSDSKDQNITKTSSDSKDQNYEGPSKNTNKKASQISSNELVEKPHETHRHISRSTDTNVPMTSIHHSKVNKTHHEKVHEDNTSTNNPHATVLSGNRSGSEERMQQTSVRDYTPVADTASSIEPGAGNQMDTQLASQFQNANESFAALPGDILSRFEQASKAAGGITDKLIQLPGGIVFLRSWLRVDADGGPEWSTDKYGQATTSLTDKNGRALNAKGVNYFVLPLGGEWAKMGVKPGDLAWVRNTANGKLVPAIFGDKGPSNKIGEGSQALCRALGLSDDPASGGTDQKNIEFLIVPHSGTGTGDIASNSQAMAERLSSAMVSA